MSMRFQKYQPQRGSVRVVNGVLAALYFMVVGMLIFFRLGPYQRVVSRFEEQGAPLPDWFNLVFTWGLAIIGVFILIRGIRALRGALRD